MDLKVLESRIPTQNDLIECNPTQPLHKQPFVSAILYLKEILKELFFTISETQENSETNSGLFDVSDVSLIPNTFHFGVFLKELERLEKEGLFLAVIKERRDEMERQKEHWRSCIEKQKKGKDQDFYLAIDSIISEGKLIPNSSGCGSAYFLVDGVGIPRYVVKPVDEDIFCLNNRKELGSIFNDTEHRVRDGIPLYRSAQTDAFCWELALLAGLEAATPKAVIGIIKDDGFYDLTHWIDEEQKEKFIEQTGFPDREKLASIQEYIPDSQDLIELLHEFYKEGLSDEEIAARFDQKDFEEVCMFLWLSYDNDGHGGNFHTFVKRIDEDGKKMYGIKKIDNGLSFPEENTQYVNILAWVPNAIRPISSDLKQKIADLPVEMILKRMDDYELYSCKDAFRERVEIIKKLSLREGITIGEIELRLTFLSYDKGKELALSLMTTQEILDLLLPKTTTESTEKERFGKVATSLNSHYLNDRGPHEAWLYRK
jgi:hypothetical protein